jgi:hypothetical protein
MDPIAKVFIDGNKEIEVNLRQIVAMHGGLSQGVGALFVGAATFTTLTTREPDALIAQWRQVNQGA